jgi:hypothetical protein
VLAWSSAIPSVRAAATRAGRRGAVWGEGGKGEVKGGRLADVRALPVGERKK